MNRNQSILQRFVHGSELSSQSLPSMPLIEIIGYNRALVENHICIISYSIQEISVRVKYGYITLQGENLHLAYMYTEKLVITGNLRNIQLHSSSGI